MTRLGRPGLSDIQKEELWRRWRNGESLSDIGRALGKHPASVFGVLRLCGGYMPLKRSRSERALTLAEREEISRGISSGQSMREIAKSLGRSPSTISREIGRNGGLLKYRAHFAEDSAWDRGRRPKLCCAKGAVGIVTGKNGAASISEKWRSGRYESFYRKSLNVIFKESYPFVILQSITHCGNVERVKIRRQA